MRKSKTFFWQCTKWKCLKGIWIFDLPNIGNSIFYIMENMEIFKYIWQEESKVSVFDINNIIKISILYITQNMKISTFNIKDRKVS